MRDYLNAFKVIFSTNFKLKSNVLAEIVKKHKNVISTCDAESLEFIGDINNLNWHYHTCHRSNAKNIIRDEQLLKELSKLFGWEILELARYSFVDLLLGEESDSNGRLKYFDTPMMTIGEDDFDPSDTFAKDYVFNGRFFFRIKHNEEELSVDVADLFEKEQLPHVFDALSLLLSVQTAANNAQQVVNAWDGLHSVKSFHMGYQSALNKERVAHGKDFLGK